MTFEAAAEALAAANSEGSSPEVAVSEPATTDAPATETADGTTGQPDSFTSVDLDSLSEVERARYDQMHGDYTRKTQEIAPFRNVLSQYGMDVDQAASALALVQSLSDPAVQQTLYERLNAVYGAGDGQGEDVYEGEESDPRDAQIEQLTSRLDQFENQQLQSRIAVELDRMENVVRQSNPDWSDGDIQRVQQIALAHGGNMLSAAEEYKGWRNELLAGYVQGKASAEIGGASLPTGGMHAEEPQTFETLDDAHKAAVARYGAELGL